MSLRDAYASSALAQIPRLLTLQDRNPFSATYGSFQRRYWLDKTEDFPDALPQFAVHALALVYAYQFPGNVYRGNPRIRDWALSGIDYWASIQHGDGSFDEFYPFERGWAGPTAFTTYAVTEAYSILREEVPAGTADRVRAAIGKAALFIARGDPEDDRLGNHHAMAALAVWRAGQLLGEARLQKGFQRLFDRFLALYDEEEGWATEYDGLDPGYLSATVSFLGKVYQSNPDPRLKQVLHKATETCSYFAYPDGSYGGSLGSRGTGHFYPHGFEVLARELPLAAALAEHGLNALSRGKLVPPGIMADRYVSYRVSEFLLAYLDYRERPAELPALPYQRGPDSRHFPRARFQVTAGPHHYMVANLAKGGVVKAFEVETGAAILNDAGLIGRLDSGRTVTSQWIDPGYRCRVEENGWEVQGYLHVVPTDVVFTPLKQVAFRAALLAAAWFPPASHLLKRAIRRRLVLRGRTAPVAFRRRFRVEESALLLEDELRLEGEETVAALSVGSEFSVRYVPQSRYFQDHELGLRDYSLTAAQVATLNGDRQIILRQRVPTRPDGEEPSHVYRREGPGTEGRSTPDDPHGGGDG